MTPFAFDNGCCNLLGRNGTVLVRTQYGGGFSRLFLSLINGMLEYMKSLIHIKMQTDHSLPSPGTAEQPPIADMYVLEVNIRNIYSLPDE